MGEKNMHYCKEEYKKIILQVKFEKLKNITAALFNTAQYWRFLILIFAFHKQAPTP